MRNYSTYVELLTENNYILALPTNKVLFNCSIDEIFILEHILQASFDNKEFSSLNGKTYEIKDKKLVLTSTPKIEVEILQRDVFYGDNNGAKNFNRIIISNSLDQRFYDKSAEVKNTNENGETTKKEVKIMRDPFE